MSHASLSYAENVARQEAIRGYVRQLPKHVAARHMHHIEEALQDMQSTVDAVMAMVTERERSADAAARVRPSTPAAANSGKPTSAIAAALEAFGVPAVVHVPVKAVACRPGAPEHERLAAIDAFAKTMAWAGTEDLIEAARRDGVSTPEDLAHRILARERASTAGAPATMHAKAALVPGAAQARGSAPAVNVLLDRAALDREARAYQARHAGTSYVDAVRAIQDAAMAAAALVPPQAHASGRVRDRAELHARALALMAEKPGTHYVDAVRKLQSM